MSGIKEIAKQNIDRIENVLNGKPDYFRGFVNFMNDSSVQTRYYYSYKKYTQRRIPMISERRDRFNNSRSCTTAARNYRTN